MAVTQKYNRLAFKSRRCNGRDDARFAIKVRPQIRIRNNNIAEAKRNQTSSRDIEENARLLKIFGFCRYTYVRYSQVRICKIQCSTGYNRYSQSTAKRQRVRRKGFFFFLSSAPCSREIAVENCVSLIEYADDLARSSLVDSFRLAVGANPSNVNNS